MLAYKLKSGFWKFCCWGGVNIVGSLAFTDMALAQNQIIPDKTLGSEQSVVTPDGATDEITGGATRSQNLFHSFEEFRIGKGNSAYFKVDNSSIANIFARVTGTNISEIQGILGTRGGSNANLFLINPNGILFGPEGSLAVEGSFIGTTANAIQFSDQSVFSASDPNSSSLVTVQPSALLFNKINSGAIENQSVADAKNQFNSVDKDGLEGLRVPDGENLLLVGGDVFLNGGDLHALGGRIELGGIESTGIVELNLDGDKFKLNFPANANLADVTLGNPSTTLFDQSKVNVTAAGDGKIFIAAKNLELYDASEITAGIAAGQGTTDQPSIGTAIRIQSDSLLVKEGSIINTDILGSGNSGDIEIRAEGILLDGQEFESDIPDDPSKDPNVDRSSKITSRIEQVGQDKKSKEEKEGGDLRINTGTLTIDNGALISTSTDAIDGNPGEITITARESVLLRNVGSDVPSTISSQVLDGARADDGGGSINLTAGSLSVKGGASINTSTESQGDTGDIKIEVEDGSIELEGAGVLIKNDKDGSTLAKPELKSSGIFSTIVNDEEKTGVGKQGTIDISSRTLKVTDGAQISTRIEGTGTHSGNIDIETKENITLSGQSPKTIKAQLIDRSVPSGIFSNLEEGGKLEEERLNKEGSIGITSKEGSLIVDEGARISSSTDGMGDAQAIVIKAKEKVTLKGKGENLDNVDSSDFSGIYSQTLENSKGDAGNISIDASSVQLEDGARILNNTRSKTEGDAGNIDILAKQSLVLQSNNSPVSIESNVRSGAIGQGGTINIGKEDQKLDSLEIKDKGMITVSTAGKGNGGSINIYTENSVLIEGDSGLGSNVNGKDVFGNGGTIKVDTNSLKLIDGGAISASTNNNGDAGEIDISAGESVLIKGEGSKIVTQLSDIARVEREAGDINLKTSSLTLTKMGSISTRSASKGNAGNVTLDVDDGIISLDNSEILSDISNSNDNTIKGDGTGGDINITTGNLELNNQANLAATNNNKGDAGNLTLEISDRLLANDSNITTKANSGAGGFIDIQAGTTILKGDSDIETFVVSGAAEGGDITIASDFVIAFDDSDILAFADGGRGGNIDFSSTIFFGESFQNSPSDINSITNTDILENNARVDINASGGLASGTVLVPDSSFVQNSVTDLPDNVIPPDQLTAGSCIARRTGPEESSFVVTGDDGLPSRPDGTIVSAFPTGTVRSVAGSLNADKTKESKSDKALTEPTEVFKLDDGRMVLSQQCN